MTKTGVFGRRQGVIQKKQSPEQRQQRSYGDMVGLSRISGVTETRNMLKKKCLGGEKMKNFSPVGFQCSKSVSTFSIYRLKAMMI